MAKLSRLKVITVILVILIQGILFSAPLSATGNGFTSIGFVPGPNYTQNDIRALLKVSGDAFGVPLHAVAWYNPDGTTAACRPLQGGCVTYNQYSSTGVLISSSHEFLISGRGRPSGIYTAVVSVCTDPHGSACYGGWTEVYRGNFYISDGSATYTISGSAGVAGATLSYEDGTTKTVTSDGMGNYTIAVPSGWSGAVTPSKTGYTFTPASKAYTIVLADQIAQDYAATATTSRIYLPLVFRLP